MQDLNKALNIIDRHDDLYIEILKFYQDMNCDENILNKYTTEDKDNQNNDKFYADDIYQLEDLFTTEVNKYLLNYLNNDNMLYLILQQMHEENKRNTEKNVKIKSLDKLSNNGWYLLEKYSKKNNSLKEQIQFDKIQKLIQQHNIQLNNLNISDEEIAELLTNDVDTFNSIIANPNKKTLLKITLRDIEQIISNQVNLSYHVKNQNKAHILRDYINNENVKQNKEKYYLAVPNDNIIEFNGSCYGSWQMTNCRTIKNLFEFKVISNFGVSYPIMLKPDLTTIVKSFVLAERDEMKTHHRTVKKIEVIQLNQNDQTVYPQNVKMILKDGTALIIKLTLGKNVIDKIDFTSGEGLRAMGMAKKGNSDQQKQLFDNNYTKYKEMAKDILKQRLKKQGIIKQEITEKQIDDIVKEIYWQLKKRISQSDKVLVKEKDNQDRTRYILDYSEIRKLLFQMKSEYKITTKDYGIAVIPDYFQIKILNKNSKQKIKEGDYYIIAKKQINYLIDQIMK